MDPIWVGVNLAVAIQEEQLAEHGGPEGIRDLGALESALARPHNLLAYSRNPPTLASLAAAYAFGIAKNHPFMDGNKRAALVIAEVFLRLNGYRTDVSKEEKYLMYHGLAEGTITEEALCEWLTKVLDRADKGSVAAQ